MKKWKNLSAVVLAVGMLAAMGISAFAGAEAEDQAQAQMQPTGMKCTKCEAGELYLTDSVDTGWYTLEYVLCQHGYPNKMDVKEEKQITNIYTCTNCKISQPSKTKHPIGSSAVREKKSSSKNKKTIPFGMVFCLMNL